MEFLLQCMLPDFHRSFLFPSDVLVCFLLHGLGS
jgi:hypothetical protein